MSVPYIIDAAYHLLGHTLDGGWKVIERKQKAPDATGGNFSVCYIVESSDGKRGFLKALDYSRAFNTPDHLRVLEFLITAYNFERDILMTCKNKRLNRVVTAITDGSYKISGSPYPVDYLIFELADGDVRDFLSISGKFDEAWALRSLHHITVGLNQLHTQGIAHQDLKPSNVLVFNGTQSKISDVGRASIKGLICPYDNFNVTADPTYAPLELLYGQVDPEWNKRRLGCDLYLLGSLVMFYFMNTGMTSSVLSKMDPMHYPEKWAKPYSEILPYIRYAFNIVINEFENNLHGELSTILPNIVQQLCEPDPNRRGHPLERKGHGNQYSLQRYVSLFNALATKAELGLLEVK